MDELCFLSLGSGSCGNCYYIGTQEYGFLIDAGIAVRNIKHALKEHGLRFEQIFGIFLTHDHMDHIKSVGVLNRKYNLPVYATQKTFNGIQNNPRIEEKPTGTKNVIKKDEAFFVRDFKIESFPVSHDASDCVGYSLYYQDKCFTIATDLGFINKKAAEHIVNSNYLVIEANYDEEMLRNGKYPYHLKERVRSSVGHLSNIHTAKFLAENWNNNISYIFLCHLSGENNTPEIACETIINELSSKQITPNFLYALKRRECSDLYLFK